VSAVCGVLIVLGWGRVSARLLALTWLAAALISSGMALLQYFGLAATLAPWLSPTLPGEAFANLRQRNQFATLTSIGLVALLACLALRTTSTATTTPSTPSIPTTLHLPGWAYVSAMLLAVGNAASSSRTGLLQWLLVLVLVLWWYRSNRRPLVLLTLLGLLMYVAAAAVLPLLLNLATGISSDGLWGRLAEASDDSRRVLWANVLTLIAQKPWFGWGWGELSYAHFITDYPDARFTQILGNAHNLPLHLAVELGVPAALLICAGTLWAVCRAKPWRDTDPARQMAWAVLAVIGVHSLLEYPLWYGPFQLALLLCVACLWRTRPAQQTTEHRPQTASNAARVSRKPRVSLRIAAAAVLLALGYTGFDYARVTQLYVPAEKRWPGYQQDTLAKVEDSWLFQPQVRFARLLTTEVTPANALAIHAMALRVLHYSPEAKVVEQLITSALLSDQRADAEFYLARFRWAYPQDYEAWLGSAAQVYKAIRVADELQVLGPTFNQHKETSLCQDRDFMCTGHMTTR
jgi:O-antigen ligase